MQHLKEKTAMILNNYHDFLEDIVCPKSSSSCQIGECEHYLGTAKLKENVINAFNKHGIDEVIFEICLQTDRYALILQRITPSSFRIQRNNFTSIRTNLQSSLS